MQDFDSSNWETANLKDARDQEHLFLHDGDDFAAEVLTTNLKASYDQKDHVLYTKK